MRFAQCDVRILSLARPPTRETCRRIGSFWAAPFQRFIATIMIRAIIIAVTESRIVEMWLRTPLSKGQVLVFSSLLSMRSINSSFSILLRASLVFNLLLADGSQIILRCS